MITTCRQGEELMAQVLIRDLETGIVDKLKRRARRSGRSLEAELRLVLERAANEEPADAMAEVERVRALFAGRRFSDSADLIREDRER
jgi:plasmid stability protein